MNITSGNPTNIYRYQVLDSTNSKLRELINEGKACEGDVVITPRQLRGRGYGTNSWESEPDKNLLFSLLLTPGWILPHQQFVLTCIISLGVREALQQILGHQYRVLIKWPNDIYVENSKICGILIENNIMGNKITQSICGVGININQLRFESDAPNPISLAMLTGKQHVVEVILKLVLERIAFYYDQLKNTGILHIIDEYHKWLYRMGEQALYQTERNTFVGTIQGVDDTGKLLINDTNGKTHSYFFKEVSFV